MKILAKLVLALTLLITAGDARADWVSGHFRSNGTYVAPYYRSSYGSLGGSPRFSYATPYYRSAYGSPGLGSSSSYVYRNPYAADPSVNVSGYPRLGIRIDLGRNRRDDLGPQA
jgi:hypothetical protein